MQPLAVQEPELPEQPREQLFVQPLAVQEPEPASQAWLLGQPTEQLSVELLVVQEPEPASQAWLLGQAGATEGAAVSGTVGDAGTGAGTA